MSLALLKPPSWDPTRSLGKVIKRLLICKHSPDSWRRYDFLIVAPGLKINFDAVKGLREGLDNPNGPVSSIYSVDSCEKTWKNIQNLKEGRAVSAGFWGRETCSEGVGLFVTGWCG